MLPDRRGAAYWPVALAITRNAPHGALPRHATIWSGQRLGALRRVILDLSSRREQPKGVHEPARETGVAHGERPSLLLVQLQERRDPPTPFNTAASFQPILTRRRRRCCNRGLRRGEQVHGVAAAQHPAARKPIGHECVPCRPCTARQDLQLDGYADCRRKMWRASDSCVGHNIRSNNHRGS